MKTAVLRIYCDIHPDSENDLHVGIEITNLLSVLGHVTLWPSKGQSTAKELFITWFKILIVFSWQQRSIILKLPTTQ